MNDIDFGLRLATTQDIALVYQWQCHPNTRRFALTADIPRWPEHLSWMRQKLQSETDYFYIIEALTCAVGVVRLDHIEAMYYLVSIYIDPMQYGKGYALKALTTLERLFPEFTLKAEVLAENTASQQLFMKANFIKESEQSFIREPINKGI
ncbi:GNAT family N-acetyltransferase [Shewanella marina]|uniref:GNAT family N-acetyltransferase n=1 Tax=Shewanella marina TaxID=487319 RepID=UPI0004718C24|nr:GNAT family N-acetyltransferase [Shewanella marina]